MIIPRPHPSSHSPGRRRTRGLILSLLLSLMLNCVIWDVKEVELLDLGSKAIKLLTGKPVVQAAAKDSLGIPVQIYRKYGTVHNPLFIARDAEEAGFGGTPQAAQELIRLTDWLYNHCEENDSLLSVPYRFDYPEYGMRSPWTSALAQAAIANAFLMREDAPGDSLWLIRSRKAMKTLDPASGTGLASRDDKGVWFWEYPSADSIMVLNGMMGTLLELDKYAHRAPDALADSLFREGVTALIAQLPRFDKHGYSLYDSRGLMAGRMYHQKHISQLKLLYFPTAHPVLKRYAMRWQYYDHLPMPWQLFRNPRPKRVLAFIFCWLILFLPGLLILRIWGKNSSKH